jgi:hypothetical protein
MKYIRSYESDIGWVKWKDVKKDNPVINDYVAVKETSPNYLKAKNKIYQITLWDSEAFYLSDLFNVGGNIGWVKWGEVRHLNNKELKKLDLIQNSNKFNI